MLIMLIHDQVSLRELQLCNAHLSGHVTDEISVIYAPDVQSYFPWILIKTEDPGPSTVVQNTFKNKANQKSPCFAINGLWPSTIKGFSLKCIIKMMGACGSVHLLI